MGLRELRRDASELVRRVERGEEIVITVSGRPSARLVPARLKHWQRWKDVAEVLNGPADPNWERDRELLDQTVRDPRALR